MIEKRKHTRLPLEVPVKIKFAGKEHLGKTKNISFGGIYVELSGIKDFSAGDICDTSLILNKDEPLLIYFKCKIVHIYESGMGMQFESIEGLDCYELFKNLMVLNSKEPDKLLEELERHPGIIMKK